MRAWSWRGQAHDRRVLLLALAAGTPGVVAMLFLLWRGALTWPLVLTVVLSWLGFALAAQEAVVRPLQTLSNLIAALREGDFSFRARAARDTGPLGEAMNAADEEWGEVRLVAAAQGSGGLPARELLGRIMAGADAFAAGAPQHDDMTIVVLRVLG